MPHHPIAITGMHRSGTSMITRALHDSGLHLLGPGADQLIDAAEDNPEGFWENKAIVACNDDLLEATGGAWDNPPALPPQAVDDRRVGHVVERASAALASLSEHDRWGFKDPRLCLTAAFWMDLQPDLLFIVAVRHPLEVALSLKRRNQNSYSLGLALWERYYATVLELVPPDRRLITHYDTFFTDPVGELGRLCEFAGLEPAAPRVRADLRHHTVGISLAEADVSLSVRALYADLCREAGAPVVPEAAIDEGRVRRLLLDGAVATRHAEQRQDAVDRLHEREAELREEKAATEAQLRAQIRELEHDRAVEVGELRTQLRQAQEERSAIEAGLRDHIKALEANRAAREAEHRAQTREMEVKIALARAEAEARVLDVQRTTVEAIRGLTDSVGGVAESAARAEARLTAVDGRTRTTDARLQIALQGGPVLRRARRLVARARRGARRRLPNRSSVRQAPAAAASTARTLGGRLPGPARTAVRRVDADARRRAAAAVPLLRSRASRLPAPARRVLRKGERELRAVLRPPIDPTALAEPRPPVAKVPEGPAPRLWRHEYERVVAAAVPEGQPWLVVTPGSPNEVRSARSPRATPFPDTADGQAPTDDLAHVAQLEAQRFAGHRLLVLPEGSRPWFRQRSELRDHIVGTYRTVVDEPGAAAVFDLDEEPAVTARSLRSQVDHLASGGSALPAVLDWTGLDLSTELSDLATFTPPPGDRLPYLDGSIDVVVIDDEHHRAEARRIAARGVITVAPGASGADVVDVEGGESAPSLGPRVLVWASPGDPGDRWTAQLGRRVERAGAELRIGAVDEAGLDALEGYEVVVLLEPHVLPLPGAIEAAARMAISDPTAAVAVKVLRSDGRLESAGGTVFSDRSVGLIGASSPDVRAAWHEFVRPVCWAPGMVAAAASLWATVPPPTLVAGRTFVREWSSQVWARGASVVYQPTVAAVRVRGDGGEPSTPLRSSGWQRVLDLRPMRPPELSDGAWRYLLAHDDIEACRG